MITSHGAVRGPEREPEEEAADSSLSPPPRLVPGSPTVQAQTEARGALEPGASHIGPPSGAGARWGQVEHRSEGTSGGYLEHSPRTRHSYEHKCEINIVNE